MNIHDCIRITFQKRKKIDLSRQQNYCECGFFYNRAELRVRISCDRFCVRKSLNKRTVFADLHVVCHILLGSKFDIGTAIWVITMVL